MKRILNYAGSDIPASIVVFLVALPLCLGIALGSGAPLFSGIIAGIVGGIIIGILSGSQLSVSGPAAGLTVIVATAIISLQSFNVFLLAVVLAGVLQVILGFVKAGVIGDYVPNAVIKGMLAAIGLILILKQLPHFVGYDADYLGDETFKQGDSYNTFSDLFRSLKFITIAPFIVGIISMLILILWETQWLKSVKWLKFVPGPLVVVLVAIGLGQLLSKQFGWQFHKEHLVTLPVAENVGMFFSFFSLPDFSAIGNPQVWKTAVTLALVASLETLLAIEAIDKLDPLKRVTPTNRELKAQGIGNMFSGLIGGLPLTSVIVRSSANVLSGARSKASAVLHGVLLLLSVLLIPKYLNYIPLSSLAAILIFTGYKLCKLPLFRHYFEKGMDQFVPFVVTIIAILLTDLLTGIVIGLFVGLFFMVRSNFKSAVVIVNDANKYLMRLRKDVSFLNKPAVKKKLEEVPPNSYILIDATRADFIDKDVIEEINSFFAHAHLKNIRFELKVSQGKPLHQLFYQKQ